MSREVATRGVLADRQTRFRGGLVARSRAVRSRRGRSASVTFAAAADATARDFGDADDDAH